MTVFITTAIASMDAEIESGSIFHETFLSTEVLKSFTFPIILNCATPAETCFAAPWHIRLLKVSKCNSDCRSDLRNRESRLA